MTRILSIDPGKNKCGLVLAETSEKKVFKATIIKIIPIFYQLSFVGLLSLLGLGHLFLVWMIK